MNACSTLSSSGSWEIAVITPAIAVIGKADSSLCSNDKLFCFSSPPCLRVSVVGVGLPMTAMTGDHGDGLTGFRLWFRDAG